MKALRIRFRRRFLIFLYQTFVLCHDSCLFRSPTPDITFLCLHEAFLLPELQGVFIPLHVVQPTFLLLMALEVRALIGLHALELLTLKARNSTLDSELQRRPRTH